MASYFDIPTTGGREGGREGGQEEEERKSKGNEWQQGMEARAEAKWVKKEETLGE